MVEMTSGKSTTLGSTLISPISRHNANQRAHGISKLCIDQMGAEQYIDFTQEKDIPAKVKELTTYGAHGSIVFAATKESYALGPNVVSPPDGRRFLFKFANHGILSSDLAGQWSS